MEMKLSVGFLARVLYNYEIVHNQWPDETTHADSAGETNCMSASATQTFLKNMRWAFQDQSTSNMTFIQYDQVS